MVRSNQPKISGKVLLQVDIEGHSAWIAAASSQPEVVKARIEIAERLHEITKSHEFKLLSWKGDGGAYAAATDSGNGNFDFSVNAALAAVKVFDEWRANSPDRSGLRLRVSLYFAPYVYVHRNHGYWASDHLDVFLEYEREIGLSGTIAVTDSIISHLTKECQKQFLFTRKRALGSRPGEDLIGEVHYFPIEEEVIFNRSTNLGLFEWLMLVDLPGGISGGYPGRSQHLNI